MIETFTALLFAHALADFVLQTDWMHRNKSKIGVMALWYWCYPQLLSVT
jgi:hypothetical protein